MDSNISTTSTQLQILRPGQTPKPKLQHTKSTSRTIQESLQDTFERPATTSVNKMPIPGTLYRWEDNAGLDHKCGTCKTVLSSPRAKKTCFGQHEEVCSKYHKTLFMIGEAHKCEACRRSRETHDKRHREIAVLVEAIVQIDETNGISTSVSGMKKKARKSDDLFDIARDADDASRFEGDLLDNIGVKDPDDTPPTPCPPNTKEAKRGQKLKKAERKMAKSQSRVKVISTEDIRRIADAIHPATGGPLGAQSHFRQNSDDPLDSKLVADNVAYVSATSEYYKSRIRKDYGARKATKSKTAPQTPTTPRPSSDEMVSILGRLNVKVIVLAASKERKGLIAKLQDAIQNDLTIVDNEDRDTMMREAGYFRYVNRRTYNAMIRNNQIWDWVSGRKLEEVDEEDEDEDGVSDEAVGDDGNAGVGGERVIEDYAEDFVLDGEELHLAERHVAAGSLDSAPCETHPAGPFSTSIPTAPVSVSSIADETAARDVAEPTTPGLACGECVLKRSIASVRKGLAEYAQNFSRHCAGNGGGRGEQEREREREQEQKKGVDTTYAITNLEPEALWG